jgi:hypothetical protein
VRLSFNEAVGDKAVIIFKYWPQAGISMIQAAGTSSVGGNLG